MHQWYQALGMLLLAVLAGCAALGDAVRPGTPREQVLQAWGRPTATYALAGGTRLQYSRQPAGRVVYNIDLDAQERVSAFEQSLQPALLGRVQVDHWTAADVQRTFGPPPQVARVGDFDGDVWTYRYLELNNQRLFHVYLDAAGVVRRAHSTDEIFQERRRRP